MKQLTSAFNPHWGWLSSWGTAHILFFLSFFSLAAREFEFRASAYKPDALPLDSFLRPFFGRAFFQGGVS